jgi:hypothetical protein
VTVFRAAAAGKKKKYELPSCPWLDGFADHQSAIFKIIVRK